MKIRLTLLLAASVLLAVLVTFVYSPNPRPENSKSSVNFKELVRSNRANLTGAESITNSHVLTGQSPENKECIHYQDAILSLNFNDYEFPPKNTTVPEVPKNCFLEKDSKLIDDSLKKCARFFDPNNPTKALNQSQWEKDFGDCKISLLFLRGRIVAKKFEGQKIEDIKDINVLGDLLLSAFSQTDAGTDAFKEIGKISERMLELDPSLYFAAKVSVMSRVMNVLPLLEKGDADWSKVDNAIERALAYHENDVKLAELILFAKSQGFKKPELAQTELSEIEKRFPGTGITDYYRAYFSWKSANRNETISHLNDAIKANPEDPRFKTTLAQVQDPTLKPGEGSPFSITLKLGLGSNDL